MGVKRGWEAHQCKVRTGSLDWKWDCVGVHIIERHVMWLLRHFLGLGRIELESGYECERPKRGEGGCTVDLVA